MARPAFSTLPWMAIRRATTAFGVSPELRTIAVLEARAKLHGQVGCKDGQAAGSGTRCFAREELQRPAAQEMGRMEQRYER